MNNEALILIFLYMQSIAWLLDNLNICMYVCYLTMLSVSRLYSVDNAMINGYSHLLSIDVDNVKLWGIVVVPGGWCNGLWQISTRQHHTARYETMWLTPMQ
jgi:hypothetical protein